MRHAGNNPFKTELTLEILTKQYDVIIWKHCFPVCDIEEDTGSPDINSSDKRIENYKLQYEALKKKMHEFPNKKFIVWTGAAKIAGDVDKESAKRARTFFEWVKTKWDEKGDNIYVWDFYELETKGGIYLKNEYAAGRDDSHPSGSFSRMAAPLFCQRIVDVIEGRKD